VPSQAGIAYKTMQIGHSTLINTKPITSSSRREEKVRMEIVDPTKDKRIADRLFGQHFGRGQRFP
jgi:hypothetical protein